MGGSQEHTCGGGGGGERKARPPSPTPLLLQPLAKTLSCFSQHTGGTRSSSTIMLNKSRIHGWLGSIRQAYDSDFLGCRSCRRLNQTRLPNKPVRSCCWTFIHRVNPKLFSPFKMNATWSSMPADAQDVRAVGRVSVEACGLQAGGGRGGGKEGRVKGVCKRAGVQARGV